MMDCEQIFYVDHPDGRRERLVQSFRMFNNLTNTGQYRVNFDIGATTQLTKWLNWNVSLSDRYLSNPVAGRRKRRAGTKTASCQIHRNCICLARCDKV